jgi:hypothetical protein
MLKALLASRAFLVFLQPAVKLLVKKSLKFSFDKISSHQNLATKLIMRSL